MIKTKHFPLFFLMLSMLGFDVLADQPKVCFYKDSYYNGASICATEGSLVNILPLKWNDRISSISVSKGMIVTVYEDGDFAGRSLTLKESIDFLSSKGAKGLNDAISSFSIKHAACFYEYDQYFGGSMCLSGGEKMDLYKGLESHIDRSLNDRVSSIKVPKNMQVTLFKDDNYNGDKITLAENYLLAELEDLDMDYAITSMTASQQENFICDQYCAIKERMIIPIKHIFGDYWHDERIGSKQVLISFKLTDNDDYLIWMGSDRVIKVKDRVIYYIHNDLNDIAYYHMNKESDRVSISSRFNGSYFESQFIESEGTKIIHLSPLIGYLFDPSDANIHFSITNINTDKSKSVVIDKAVMTVEKAQHRSERAITGLASCWAMPLLSIYNYVVQGRCNQVERFVDDVADFFGSLDDKILQVSGSSKPLPKVDTDKAPSFDGGVTTASSELDGILTYVRTGLDKKSLTVPATALACRVSMKEQLLPHLRIRRDLTPTCIDWTLDILTDFTLLFGDSIARWNAENFGLVIERIIQNGDTGYAVSDTNIESRLVHNVMAHIADSKDDELLRLKSAFDFSQLSYATYQHHTHDQSAVVSPQQSQELLLGRYELALENFNMVETIPRVRQAGQWVEHPELHFDIEIITGRPAETLAARRNVIPIIENWRQSYNQPYLPTPVSSTEEDPQAIAQTQLNMDSVISAARIVGDVAQSWLRTTRDDYIYLIVRLSGQIVSITLAVDINEEDVGIAASLTNPAYVLHPRGEGVVRGAGTAAVRALADYAAKKGKRALVADVISQPSAIVKHKVGFRFIDEL
ncbi:Beta-gamma-crystallin [Yersinia mollaretii ATCC 43969]|uniref:Beta-gamma-crystallin n=1 Tax=Yersinia mollaretii (strain ATCC 43969 / DSM 18520 / CIP 103324 / CNY 7263 / WAIP 204) TaxID=349967 RepID=A0ABP2EDC5_YERMW|nr:peptidase inhibitor family I36 protein [Yersinia mollaretii]EEQ09990.1 Beta-gamma-crystallin [Yersinia mollaretii ATCC 43969]QKJ05074.1 peptidase inhibitor family I36 protein [Yersinia mollaretii ATCC 43969]